MSGPAQERQIYRTPGQLVVISLACLYAVPTCFLLGAILEANDASGDPFFGLGRLFGAIWGPILLLAIVVQLVGPAPPENQESS